MSSERSFSPIQQLLFYSTREILSRLTKIPLKNATLESHKKFMLPPINWQTRISVDRFHRTNNNSSRTIDRLGQTIDWLFDRLTVCPLDMQLNPPHIALFLLGKMYRLSSINQSTVLCQSVDWFVVAIISIYFKLVLHSNHDNSSIRASNHEPF